MVLARQVNADATRVSVVDDEEHVPSSLRLVLDAL
jgi:hypothetical protein